MQWYLPPDSLKANFSLNPLKSFFKKIKFSASFNVFLFKTVNSRLSELLTTFFLVAGL